MPRPLCVGMGFGFYTIFSTYLESESLTTYRYMLRKSSNWKQNNNKVVSISLHKENDQIKNHNSTQKMGDIKATIKRMK